MKCLIFIAVLLYTGFSSILAQEIEGEWEVTKINRVYNYENIVLYERSSEDNILNYPEMIFMFSPDGTYTATRGATATSSGNWNLSNDYFTMSGVSLPITFNSREEFYTTREIEFRHPINGLVVGNVEVYYTNSTLLPVSIVNFSLFKIGKNIKLEWQTEIEENSSYFEIERSIDGVVFAKVGEVQSKGSYSNYRYINENNSEENDVIFFRLKMIDQDGSFNYSTIKNIEIPQNYLRVYPNPTRNIINYLQSSGLITDFRLLSIDGKLITSGVAEERGAINISSLPKGIYQLVFYRGSKAINYSRVLKM